VRGVALIVVHYRNTADTIECLDSVLQLEVPEGVRRSVIVVDNASEDGSWKQLLAWRAEQPSLWSREFGPSELTSGAAEASTHRLVDSGWEITMLRAQLNGGYAAGANLGLRFAMREPSITDYWVLNNDVVLEPASLRHLVEASEGRPGAIYGATLLYQDDPSTIQAAGGAVYLPPIGRSRHFGKRRNCEDLIVPPKFDYIIGASLFFSKDVIEEIGILPEAFHLYFEETEFCARGKSRGIALVWVPEARLVHKEGRSTGAGSGFRRLSDLSFRFIVRNSMLFTEMRHPAWLMTVLLFNMFECVRHCCFGDFGKARVLVEALNEYWARRGEFAREASVLGD